MVGLLHVFSLREIQPALSEVEGKDLGFAFSANQQPANIARRGSFGLGGFAHHQLGRELLVDRNIIALLHHRAYAFEHDAHRGAAHLLHRLADSGERRHANASKGNVVEANHGALSGDLHTSFFQGADGAQRGHVIEGHNGAEVALLL